MAEKKQSKGRGQGKGSGKAERERAKGGPGQRGTGRAEPLGARVDQAPESGTIRPDPERMAYDQSDGEDFSGC